MGGLGVGSGLNRRLLGVLRLEGGGRSTLNSTDIGVALGLPLPRLGVVGFSPSLLSSISAVTDGEGDAKRRRF